MLVRAHLGRFMVIELDQLDLTDAVSPVTALRVGFGRRKVAVIHTLNIVGFVFTFRRDKRRDDRFIELEAVGFGQNARGIPVRKGVLLLADPADCGVVHGGSHELEDSFDRGRCILRKWVKWLALTHHFL